MHMETDIFGFVFRCTLWTCEQSGVCLFSHLSTPALLGESIWLGERNRKKERERAEKMKRARESFPKKAYRGHKPPAQSDFVNPKTRRLSIAEVLTIPMPLLPSLLGGKSCLLLVAADWR